MDDSPNDFVGTSQFAGEGFTASPNHYRDWFSSGLSASQVPR